MSQPLIIWDVDGTIIDSRHIINASMQRAFTACGLAAPDYDATRQIVGLSLDVAIDRLAPRGMDHDGVMALVEAYKTAFVELRQSGEDLEPAYEGLPEILLRISERGWAQGIATGKSRKGLNAIVDRMDWHDLFACHYCADDGPGKPHPSMIEKNLNFVGALPEQAVMIGDTGHDMAMAKHAGVFAIGVNWGFHTAQEIRAAGANVICETPEQLQAAIDAFARKQAA